MLMIYYVKFRAIHTRHSISWQFGLRNLTCMPFETVLQISESKSEDIGGLLPRLDEKAYVADP